MGAAVVAVPYFLWKILPIPYFSFTTVYTCLLLLTGLPTIVGYWTLMSHIGGNRRSHVILPGKDIEEYMTIVDPELKAKYHGQVKIPMQVFHDAYFEDKIEIKGESQGFALGGAGADEGTQATCSTSSSTATTGLRSS